MATIAHRTASSSAALAMTSAVLLVVAVVPLLLDLSNVDDTYYGLKARGVLALGAVVAASLILDDRRPRTTPADLPFIVFAGVAVTATAFSVDPLWALRGSPWRHEGLAVYLAYLLIGMASTRLGEGNRVRWTCALLAGATIAALYGVAQYVGLEWLPLDPSRRGWSAAFSTTGNPNYLGAYMVLVLPFMLAWTPAGPRTRRLTSIAGVALLFLTMLFSFSRAAWGAGLFAVALFTVLARRYTKTAWTRLAVPVVIVAVLTLLFAIPNGPLAPRGGSSALDEAWTVMDVRGPSFTGRLYIWARTLELIARRPALGYGPDTFARAFSQRWDEERQRIFGPRPLLIDKAHSDTLDMAMSFGLAGLAAYWWIVVAGLRAGLRTVRLGGEQALRGIAGVTAIGAYLVALQFGFSVVSVAPVFWSVLGATISLGRGSER